jgi:hypothetical protein
LLEKRAGDIREGVAIERDLLVVQEIPCGTPSTSAFFFFFFCKWVYWMGYGLLTNFENIQVLIPVIDLPKESLIVMV